MASEKLLTVSIAAYNVANYIRQALDSLAVPSPYMEMLDVVVVNDGSKDDTLQIAQEYARRYPGTFRVVDKPNGGYGSTINTSLPIAKGRYYKLLDADDWFDMSGLCGLLDYLRDSDADIVVSPFFEIKGDKTLISLHAEIPPHISPIAELKLDSDKIFRMHGITVKTQALRQVNRPVTEKCFYTDIEYVFYCFTGAQTIARFDQVVYCYRLGEANQSSSLASRRRHYKDPPKMSKSVCECYCAHETQFHGAKREIMMYIVASTAFEVFNGYALLEKPHAYKSEVVAFDRMIRQQYPQAYEAGMCSKAVQIVRKSNYHLYWLLVIYMKWVFYHSKNRA